MKSTLLKTLQGYKPLLYWKDRLLLSRGFDLVLADLALTQFIHVARLPARKFKRFLSHLRSTSRLLRLEVGPACDLGDGIHCLLCHQGTIYRLNVEEGSLVQEFVLPHGGRPLRFTRVNVAGFHPGIYLGEYFGNPGKGEARIFHRDENGRWTTTFTFPHGEINHVHNIVQDPDRHCLYVLTGDFGDAAAIWEAREQFTRVTRIGSPGQNSRACWLQVTTDRLIYATDTQLELNHLNCVPLGPHGFEPIQTLQPVAGSSIYRADTAHARLVFSTAVEPDRVRGNKYLELFSTRRGAGILTDDAHIYAGHLDGEVHSIFQATKDALPFRLFQFGSLQFPAGICPRADLLHAYGTALKNIDGCTVLLSSQFDTESPREQS
ncbi:hypothetical protein [Variovorax sp. dw_308]|uniref:hypothetical protein n=1 Tax=Variovorax sp. dw_308 TaxID=2721546 RepID=UPI001C453276|nr:hypothetical protein [Variovorax sp. dw_308]